jgi:hypothetical protein
VTAANFPDKIEHSHAAVFQLAGLSLTSQSGLAQNRQVALFWGDNFLAPLIRGLRLEA